MWGRVRQARSEGCCSGRRGLGKGEATRRMQDQGHPREGWGGSSEAVGGVVWAD